MIAKIIILTLDPLEQISEQQFSELPSSFLSYCS